MANLARSPFSKDEELIDYDKDSEEDLAEENAEDIKSSENSDEEEEGIEDEEDKWIVPDDHLSEDEISGVEGINNSDKVNNIMELLEIRKNYTKHIVIDMSKRDMNPKFKSLYDLLKAKSEYDFKFPIKIQIGNGDDRKLKQGINMFIEDKLEDIVQEIHFSHFTKDYLVKVINEKHSAINKTAISKFIKHFATKETHEGAVNNINLENMDD